MTEKSKLVKAYLLVNAMGKDRAVPIKTISKNIGISPRDVELAKEEIIREQYHPICSETRTSNGHKPGYFIAQNIDEMKPYYLQTEARIRHLCIHRAMLRKTALARFGEKIGKQLSLFSEGKV